MDEQEEFEFRLRLERESGKASPPGNPVTTLTAGPAVSMASGVSAPAVASAGHNIKQGAGNLLAGAVRGAGSIGATILAPYDIAKDYLDGKGLSLESNRARRAGIDGGLELMGAEPDSMLYKGGKIAGEIAGTAGAGGVLAKGAQALGASAPLVSSLASGGLNVAGRSGLAGLATRAVGGAATGGITAGMVNPEDAGTGAMIGGALPVAAKAGAAALRSAAGGTMSLVEPLYQAGRDKIVGRSLREFAGGQADDAIRNLQGAGELIPGSVPTVAEAARVPSLAALQRASVNVSPEMANALETRLAANNQARIDLLQNMAGSGGAKAAAEAARDQAADAAYGAARQADAARLATVRQQLLDEARDQAAKNADLVGLGSVGNAPAPVAINTTAEFKPSAELLELAKRPAMQGFIREAKTLAANKGQAIGDPLSTIDGLHYVKLALDDGLSGTPTSALSRNAKAAVAEMKTLLTQEMDKVSPVYGAARTAYRDASKPINQMQVAEELLKSVNPLNGKLRASQFAGKLTDKTAQTATGFKGATLDNTLDPGQLQQLLALRDDLARADFAANAGRPVGTNTIQNLAYGNMIGRLGVPTFLKNSAGGQVVGGLLSKAGDVVYSKANREIAEQMAQTMLSPQEAARVMSLSNQPNLLLINAAQKGLLGASRAAPVLTAQ